MRNPNGLDGERSEGMAARKVDRLMEKHMTAHDKSMEKSVLVTVSGADTPGITSKLTSVLAQSDATILDIGQAVIHGLLSLSILFRPKPGDERSSTVKDLLFAATELGLKLDFQVIDPKNEPKIHHAKHHYALTLIAEELTASVLHQVTAALVKHDINIETIQRLSQDEFSCVEILLGTDREVNRRKLGIELLSLARHAGVDVALQSEGLFRRAKRLIVMDMDSTLIQNEVIDEFARELGTFEEVSRITEEAMKGKLDFEESLRRRVAFLEGLTLQQVDNVYKRIQITDGAEQLIRVLRKLGYKVALISGGFRVIANRLQERLGLDYIYANQLEWKDGVCQGRVIPPIVNAQRKADLLEMIAQQEKIVLDQVVAVGDGANDLLMLERAGLGIAFNAKPKVREKADLELNRKNLQSILYLLGFSARDFSKALE